MLKGEGEGRNIRALEAATGEIIVDDTPELSFLVLIQYVEKLLV
jgi:hypothetical protein